MHFSKLWSIQNWFVFYVIRIIKCLLICVIFCQQVIVVDVFDKKNCVVKTDDGSVLEGE